MSWPSGRQLDGGIDRIALPTDVDGALFLCGKHVVGPDPEAVRAQLGAGAGGKFRAVADQLIQCCTRC